MRSWVGEGAVRAGVAMAVGVAASAIASRVSDRTVGSHWFSAVQDKVPFVCTVHSELSICMCKIQTSSYVRETPHHALSIGVRPLAPSRLPLAILLLTVPIVHASRCRLASEVERSSRACSVHGMTPRVHSPSVLATMRMRAALAPCPRNPTHTEAASILQRPLRAPLGSAAPPPPAAPLPARPCPGWAPPRW